MNIIDAKLSFGSMTTRKSTKRIILHHAAAKTASPQDIHKWHIARGWAGAGYHFLVRKDGSVYSLRPENKVGAHASNNNSDSIGICFEGDFMVETMNDAQKRSGAELVAYLKGKYGISKVQKHGDVGSTSCPGKNFPFSEIVSVTGSTPTAATTNAASSASAFDVTAWVRELQQECNNQGFSRQTVDGKPGKNTLAGCPTVRKNASGNITKLIQKRLIALGYSCGNSGADGKFGAGTEAAVKAYQKDKGLSVDGIVGQKTWRALLGL